MWNSSSFDLRFLPRYKSYTTYRVTNIYGNWGLYLNFIPWEIRCIGYRMTSEYIIINLHFLLSDIMWYTYLNKISIEIWYQIKYQVFLSPQLFDSTTFWSWLKTKRCNYLAIKRLDQTNPSKASIYIDVTTTAHLWRMWHECRRRMRWRP